MKSDLLRQSFIDYFKKHKHAAVPSSRLVPEDDPTLLFTNAGMNQFKNVFLGLETRNYTRAVSSQKCVRAGGKHNDLENVGHTARHHTFFEMLGNFSFGDYFKKDAIHMAWELITREWQIDKNRLYITVFQDDDEAAELWHTQEGVPKERIYRFGEKDNFWRMGDSGPCGPCSEIFYDLGPKVPGRAEDNVMGGNGDRFMEFWNLVFMQFYEDGKGGRTSLPKPSVDTGMGLERLCMIQQGKVNSYDTDLFQDLISVASQKSGVAYQADNSKTEELNVALRVLADHARAAAFLIGDGVLPSNEGRGYVLRRIMRRAIRYGRKLNAEQSLYLPVVEAVIKKMGGFYKDLQERRNIIERAVADEESRFLTTLDQGTHVLAQELDKLSEGGTLKGEVAFKLYDTYGFPLDLTSLMSQERGFRVDETGFQTSLEAAKAKARASWKGKGISADQAALVKWTGNLAHIHGPTQFTGYEGTESSDGKLLAIRRDQDVVMNLKSGEEGIVIANSTPFYAEGGGQIGDHGQILSPTGHAEVMDCTKLNDIYLHFVRVTDGQLTAGQNLEMRVTPRLRRDTARNHSATHLLHSALRKVLGEHVQQAGSLVTADRLRFDFTHSQPLTTQQLQEIETLVNQEISGGYAVQSEEMSHKAALAKGALALFGEKYGDQVRVIQIGQISTELCGGTHVRNTSDIRVMKIVSESGVSSGVRRVEAITGDNAIRWLDNLSREALQARNMLGVPTNWQQIAEPHSESHGLMEAIESKQKQARDLEREVQSLKRQSIDTSQLIGAAKEIKTSLGAIRLLVAQLDIDDRKALSQVVDQLRDQMQNAVVVALGASSAAGYPLLVSLSKSLSSKLNAGDLLKRVTKVTGGKGGGRPEFAQGSADNPTKLTDVQTDLIQFISEI